MRLDEITQEDKEEWKVLHPRVLQSLEGSQGEEKQSQLKDGGQWGRKNTKSVCSAENNISKRQGLNNYVTCSQ